MNSSFSRLHPHLRHAIVHELGWRELRPVQDLTIDAVLEGDSAVVLAPTAGGKTEASLFPVLSEILRLETPPVAALYLCPIRALLNNQEERVRGYARMVGLDAFVWHGDVSDSPKNRFRLEPAHLLMTTPESLEVMLVSSRTDAGVLFANLGFVIVDEVHAFAGDARGAHLASLLERVGHLAGRDLLRIGLSATVGNPDTICTWLGGSSHRKVRLVDPPRPPADRALGVEYNEALGSTAGGIVRIARGKKSLVFVESRAKAEQVAHALGGSGVDVFIHHSSVSRADRAFAEARFTSGENTAIVCTSTMELGIDVGDLDEVIQVDAPSSVASFLQRLGRSGRRTGTQSRGTFFCTSPESLLQALAIIRLSSSGWVEDVRPAERAAHVLAHQILALTLEEGGISRHLVLPRVWAAYSFRGLDASDLGRLVDTMVEREILYESDGRLTLGQRGEWLYGRRNFFELYAVFSAPPMLRVLHGKDEVGLVQASFVQAHDGRNGPLCFRLAGRAWQVVFAELGRGVLSVQPADHGQLPTWLGQPGHLSYSLCQAMRDLLMKTAELPASISASASAELDSLREGYAGVLEQTVALEEEADTLQWHTFAGGAINRLLAAGLENVTHEKWVAGNLRVKAQGVTLIQVREALDRLPGLGWEGIAVECARAMQRGQVSKFQPCLPTDMEDRLIVDTLLDVEGTRRLVGCIHPARE